MELIPADNLYYTNLKPNEIPSNSHRFLRVIDLDKFIKRLEGNVGSEVSTIMMFRTGGIGDIIAMSSICCYYRHQEILFVTGAQYFPVFDWFPRMIKLADINGVILKGFTDHFAKIGLKKYRRFWVEGLIEVGDRSNWYELFFAHAGFEQANTLYFRPQLNTERINDKLSNLSITTIAQKILIVNKASVMHRSIEASEILKAIIINSGIPWHFKKYYVYQNNLTERDIQFIDELNSQLKQAQNCEIKILKPTDLETHLLDLYDADLVISVDTAAIHFREGIQKPAIGLYNSFTTDSRTKHYKFTYSYDLTSECEMQPCFIHCKTAEEFCPKVEAWQFSAPCVRSEDNPTLQEQLKEILSKHLDLF